VAQIFALASRKVVQDRDGVTLVKEPFGEMTANEPRSASNQTARHAVAFLV
jgi:hypothetical protein